MPLKKSGHLWGQWILKEHITYAPLCDSLQMALDANQMSSQILAKSGRRGRRHHKTNDGVARVHIPIMKLPALALLASLAVDPPRAAAFPRPPRPRPSRGGPHRARLRAVPDRAAAADPADPDDGGRRSLLHAAAWSLAGTASSGPVASLGRRLLPTGGATGVAPSSASAARALGLVQFPCPPGTLGNRYHLLRAGESGREAAGILGTNPLFLTNREEDALTPRGVRQVSILRHGRREIERCHACGFGWHLRMVCSPRS